MLRFLHVASHEPGAWTPKTPEGPFTLPRFVRGDWLCRLSPRISKVNLHSWLVRRFPRHKSAPELTS